MYDNYVVAVRKIATGTFQFTFSTLYSKRNPFSGTEPRGDMVPWAGTGPNL